VPVIVKFPILLSALFSSFSLWFLYIPLGSTGKMSDQKLNKIVTTVDGVAIS